VTGGAPFGCAIGGTGGSAFGAFTLALALVLLRRRARR
jgi:hypothetical protein